MFVHFRKRHGLDVVLRVNDAVVKAIFDEETPSSVTPAEQEAIDPEEDDPEPPAPPQANQGQLVLDATCAPADIRYPTDLELLNEARAQSERIIDE